MKRGNNMVVVMVTGGSGLIGSNVTRELVKEGHKVVLVDNRRDNAFNSRFG